MDEKDGVLHSQIGNPEGADEPNKKHIDPRKWLHRGERGMAARVVQAFEDQGSRGKFDF
jgi:fructose-bisphosphate aldolase class II